MSRYLLNVERSASRNAVEQDESNYPFIREALAPQYKHLSNRDIEQLFYSQFGEAISPADIEFSLGDFGRAVGKVAGVVLPVVGTVVGGAFGGPVGAALGGALGSATGGAIGNVTRPAPPPPPRPAPPPPPRSAPPPRPAPPATVTPLPPRPAAVPPPGIVPPMPVPQTAVPMPAPQPIAPGSLSSAAQLMGTLLTPQMLQALLALLLGQAGQRSVLVGNTEVPIGAFPNLLSTLANQAAAEYNASTYNAGEDVPRYLMDADGEFVVDPAIPEQRAAVLLEMLGRANAQPARSIDPSARPHAAQMSLEDLYDAIELAEFYEDLEDFEDIEDFEDTEWED